MGLLQRLKKEISMLRDACKWSLESWTAIPHGAHLNPIVVLCLCCDWKEKWSNVIWTVDGISPLWTADVRGFRIAAAKRMWWGSRWKVHPSSFGYKVIQLSVILFCMSGFFDVCACLFFKCRSPQAPSHMKCPSLLIWKCSSCGSPF